MISNETVHIIGGGLVGSLLAIGLSNKGAKVHMYEKRKDPRSSGVYEGRSINLALSHRGIHALEYVQPTLSQQVLNAAVPMRGRCVHDTSGNLHFQTYSNKGEYINSIGRGALNLLLINAAEQNGVQVQFESACVGKNERHEWLIETNQVIQSIPTKEWVFATDGANSIVRRTLTEEGKIISKLNVLDYSYKELDIPTELAQRWKSNWESLHIWPREHFMLIALPNADGSLTCTLFLPNQHPKDSFELLQKSEDVFAFFQTYFPDTLACLPDLWAQWEKHPTSQLATLDCGPWFDQNTLCLGDAAHAIVPFYGQGMNAGFEDVRILLELIDKNPLGSSLWEIFYQERKRNTDAIAYLALQNFLEMRDHVDNDDYLLIKKIEQVIAAYDTGWESQYTHVSFRDTPYAEALQLGQYWKRMYQEMMETIPNIKSLNDEVKDTIINIYLDKKTALKSS
ncbi:MAG: NAD(P)/FAD-dependent oxidoreductase [Cytophagaceae bacterium]